MAKAKKKAVKDSVKKNPKLDLPESVFIEREVDGDDKYLVSWESAEDAVCANGDEVIVGRYELKEIVRLKKTVTIETETV